MVCRALRLPSSGDFNRSSLSFLRCPAAYVGSVNGAIPEYSNFLSLYLEIWFTEVGSLHSWPRIGSFLIIIPDVSLTL
jgi:hypothetical protein